MGVLATTRARKSQPQQWLGINQADPRNRLLLGGWDLGRSLEDLSKYRETGVDTAGAGFSRQTHTLGNVAKFVSASNPRVRVGDADARLNVTGAYTVVTAINVTTAGGASFGRIIDTGQNADGTLCGFAIHMAGAATTVRLNNTNSAGVADSLPNIVAGKWHLVIAHYDGTNGTVWVDGQPGTTTACDPPSTIVGNTMYPSIGNRAGGSNQDRGFDGFIGPVLVYGRGWSTSEIRSLGREARNIYSLFERKRTIFPVAVPASIAVPTLSAASVTSITATTAKPRVTITF